MKTLLEMTVSGAVAALTFFLLGVACGPPRTADTPNAALEVPLEAAEGPEWDYAAEPEETPYSRSEYGSWRDYDRDCQDARQEVLIAESEVPVTFKDGKTCKVATGRWTCPYTGTVVTEPGALDIDHMVPLREAHGSGGWAWERDKKRLYSNDLKDPNHLIATTASSNRSKGSRAPHEWMPPRVEFWCEYLKAWMGVKRAWGLTMTCEESQFIALQFEASCK